MNGMKIGAAEISGKFRADSVYFDCCYLFTVYTMGGNANNVPCHFPFWYNGRKYRQCTMTKKNGTDPSHYWCATTYNLTKDGKWGNCFAG